MNKVAIIVCYYGKFPEWFNIWLESCKYNSTFDFIIITDNFIANLPENVKTINMEFNLVKNIFSKTLGFDVTLETPYKLCDFRPIYGKAFKDYISNYEFWGHCDLDLIWGDLKKFITDDILNEYDLIGIYGHLMIYRNNDKMNNLFKEKGGTFSYQKVYTHKENFGFDETTGINRIALKNNVKQYKYLKIANMSPSVSRFKIYELEAIKEFYLWKNGKVLRAFLENDMIKVDEYAYIHFSGKKPKNALIGKNNIDSDIYLDATLIEARYNKSFSKNELELRNRFIDKKTDKSEMKKYKKIKIKKFLKEGFYQKIILLRKKLFLTQRR